MRALVILLGVSCLALGACSKILGLDKFEDAPRAGDGGSGGTAGTGVGGGAGIDGGVAITCQKEDVEFDVFPLANFPNLFSLENGRSLFVATDPTSTSASAHVILWGSFQEDGGQQSLLRIKSITDNQKGPVNTTIYGEGLRVFGAYADQSKLHVFTRADKTLRQLDFPIESGVVTDAAPAETDLFTCPGVMQLESVGVAWAQANPGFAATCKDASNTQLFVWDGNTAQLMATGPPNDESLKVQSYVYAEGVHLIATEDAHYRYGSNPTEFAVDHSIEFGDGETFNFKVMPYLPLGSPTPTGVILLLAHLKSNSDLEAFLGSVETKDYSLLDGTSAPPGFQPVLPDPSKAPGIENAGYNPNAIDLAGGSMAKDGQGNSTLYFWKLTRQGVPMVLHHPVTTGKIQVAGAVPFGFKELVVWVREDPFAVRAQNLLCIPDNP